MKIFFELLYNLSIVVSMSIISGFIGYRGKNDWRRALLQGLVFGSTSVIGMLHPLVITSGLIFDARSVMISLSGLFFGPIAATVAGLMALALRIYQGGVGTIMGVLVIISSALFGNFFYAQNKQHDKDVTMKQLLFMGVIVHISMILLMLTLPGSKGISTIKLLGLPILIAYPIGTVIIGQILSESKERRRTEQALKGSEYTFRKLFEDSADPILIMENNKFIDCNQATIELLGYGSKESILGKSPWEISPEKQPDGKLSEERAFEIVKFAMNNKNYKFQWWLQKHDGTLLPVEIMITSILLKGKKVFHILLRDISERKQMELELEFLSYHDQLTGLYNRRFFEEVLIRLDIKKNFPLTMVMADLNGLKLINDSFGHAMGDELLKKVAEVMLKGCRADDIIARLGGDEFVILLPKTDNYETDMIIKRIKDIALKEKVGSIDLSVSFGWETKYSDEEKIQDIFKKAEDHMYKKKLFESPSMRGKTINAIISTLHEKNKREEQHSHRVSIMCKNIGEALDLPIGEIEELKTVGLLHDIGKIAIEENILNKPGKLTVEEWDEIKRHPEIGYRILSTVNDMSEMAEYVLYHHEKWDGRGYPKGLTGREIPLQSRIIALADTYDAITSERSYRSALSEETAIEEIRKNAGKQFDPEIARIFIEKVLDRSWN